jgi:hypothetical protein
MGLCELRQECINFSLKQVRSLEYTSELENTPQNLKHKTEYNLHTLPSSVRTVYRRRLKLA